MNRILSIDPSGTGTTGIFFTNETEQEFHQFTNQNWKEHLRFLVELIKEKQPNLILYEHTNYINLKGVDMTSLFKLFGSLETLSYLFEFVAKIDSIPVHQVKEFYKKLYHGNKTITELTYEVGRGKGWMWQGKRISIHQLDALLVYLIWSKKY